MHDLFNPARLRMLEDQKGAIAYGYVARRVFYARFVGRISDVLGERFVSDLEVAASQVPALACFADASALSACGSAARVRFERFVSFRRARLASLVILSWPCGVGAAARAFATALGEPVELLFDPLEFERTLGNVVPAPGPAVTQLPQVWQVHAPG